MDEKQNLIQSKLSLVNGKVEHITSNYFRTENKVIYVTNEGKCHEIEIRTNLYVEKIEVESADISDGKNTILAVCLPTEEKDNKTIRKVLGIIKYSRDTDILNCFKSNEQDIGILDVNIHIIYPVIGLIVIGYSKDGKFVRILDFRDYEFKMYKSEELFKVEIENIINDNNKEIILDAIHMIVRNRNVKEAMIEIMATFLINEGFEKYPRIETLAQVSYRKLLKIIDNYKQTGGVSD